jgi:hypothetical protein
MNNTIIYANSEHEREDLPAPLRADRWMWQTGNRWAAVFSDWHADWWVGADDDDIAARPPIWSHPIADIPTTGTLAYLDGTGHAVERPAPSHSRRTQFGLARALAADAGGPVTVDAVVRRASSRLTIEGIGRRAAASLAQRLSHALKSSGYGLPGGQINVSVTSDTASLVGPSVELAIACAVLAADGQIDPERLATHALTGELAADGSLNPVGDASEAATAAFRAGACAVIANGDSTCGLPLRYASTLGAVLEILERGPLPSCCPVCAGEPKLLGGEELIELRESAPDGAPAHAACCEEAAGWRCANVMCPRFACYLGRPTGS